MPDADPDDPIAAAEVQLFNLVMMMFQLRLRAAAEERVRRLEDAAGRELADVRGQLARLFGHDLAALPEVPSAGESAVAPVKRGRGRPPKFPTDTTSPDPTQPQ